jgi:hypothetical protein
MCNELGQPFALLPRRSKPRIWVTKPSQSRVNKFIAGGGSAAGTLSVERPAKNELRRTIMLVAIEVTDGDGMEPRGPQGGRCGLEVILAKGRRIELSRDFDAVQLRRAIEVLEGF